ncbi:MAG: hypothetical protein ACFFEA_14755, partial [Candidatus Thorarchaeota archaeon]
IDSYVKGELVAPRYCIFSLCAYFKHRAFKTCGLSFFRLKAMSEKHHLFLLPASEVFRYTGLLGLDSLFTELDEGYLVSVEQSKQRVI